MHAFAIEADLDLTQFASNTFEIEWPPKSGRRQSFPEIDRIAYFALPDAMTKIVAYQKPLLRELRHGSRRQPDRKLGKTVASQYANAAGCACRRRSGSPC